MKAMKNKCTLMSVLLVSALLTGGLEAKAVKKQGIVGQPAVGCCCPESLPIFSVPYTIAQSNTTYCVQNNLTGGGITIASGVQDIVIDFNGYELYSGFAIFNSGSISNVIIKNGRINGGGGFAGIVLTSFGSPSSFDRVIIENMILENSFSPIYAAGSDGSNLIVRKSDINTFGFGVYPGFLNNLTVRRF